MRFSTTIAAILLSATAALADGGGPSSYPSSGLPTGFGSSGTIIGYQFTTGRVTRFVSISNPNLRSMQATARRSNGFTSYSAVYGSAYSAGGGASTGYGYSNTGNVLGL